LTAYRKPLPISIFHRHGITQKAEAEATQPRWCFRRPGDHVLTPVVPTSIRQMMKSTFRWDGSLRARSVRGIETSFTITMDDAYDYNILGDIDRPDDLHEELAT
jgi:hypothetical protein